MCHHQPACRTIYVYRLVRLKRLVYRVGSQNINFPGPSLRHCIWNIQIYKLEMIPPPKKKKEQEKNHGTQDSRVVPHRGTNWAALWLTAQIERDAVLSESYGRG
jgi:hypothetical protein